MTTPYTTWALGAGLALFGLAACAAPAPIKRRSVEAGESTPVRPGPGGQVAHGHGAREGSGLAHIHAELPDSLGFDLVTGWFDPWVHRHFSPRGTPYVHTFGVEPAFIDRDLFLDVGIASGPAGDVVEYVAELEWGLTRRLGVVIEMPYARTTSSGGQEETGIGDVAIGPRAFLVETDRFLGSVNLEFTLPTGDDERGLGSGELAIAPSLSLWLDAGHWVQVNVQLGAEIGMETGNEELFHGIAGSWTFAGPTPFGDNSRAHVDGHFPPGMTSAIVELLGRRVIEGSNVGAETGTALFGLSYALTGYWELRAAFVSPVSGLQDQGDGIILSAIFHF